MRLVCRRGLRIEVCSSWVFRGWKEESVEDIDREVRGGVILGSCSVLEVKREGF